MFLFIITLAIPAGNVYAADSIITSGKPYTVSTGPLTNVYYGRNDTPNTGKLTDGVYGTGVFDMSNRNLYNRGLKRSVVIDLGSVHTVHNMELYTWQHVAAGVIAPEYVKFYISQDGVNWGLVQKKLPALLPTTRGEIRETFAISNLKLYGKYVRVDFPVEISVVVDEFRCWGVPGVESGATAPAVVAEPAEFDMANSYMPAGTAVTDGVSDKVLLITGYHPTPGVADYTAEEIKPYVAHMVNGVPTDWMFDGVAWLFFNKTSSGRNLVSEEQEGGPSNKADWDQVLNTLFSSTYQLDALNTAVGQLKAELNDPARKMKVTIALPFPDAYQSNFGDVDGDGVSENLNWRDVGETASMNNRLKAAKWFMNEVMSRWNASGYQHLQLSGFYWSDEEVAKTTSLKEYEFVKGVADYIHGNNLKFEWIPFNQAAGFRNWKQLGFDVVSMQPGYAFSDTNPRDGIAEAASYAKAFGMGLEMETHWDIFVDDQYWKKAYDYLEEGLPDFSNYQNGVYTTYYQNVYDYQYSYESNSDTPAAIADPEKAKLYEDTYNWIKGTYDLQQNFFSYLDNFDSGAAGNYTLGSTGSITADLANEVIKGSRSLKGRASTGNWYEFAKSDPSKMKIPANANFKVEFDYKMITAPASNGYVYFLMRTAAGGNGNDAVFHTFTGADGSSGHKVITGKTRNFTDYQAIFGVYQPGSVSIDNVKVTIYPEDDFEGGTAGSYNLSASGQVSTTSGEVISGGYSLKGTAGAEWTEFAISDPNRLKLEPNKRYIITFDYKVLSGFNGGDYAYAIVRSAAGGNENDAMFAVFDGPAGTQQSKWFAFETRNYADYKIIFGLHNSGAISIDNIKLLVR